MKSLIPRLALVAILGAVGAGAFWAGQNSLTTPELPQVEVDWVTYEVATGSVGETMRVSVECSWPEVDLILAGSGGVVTSVDHESGTEVTSGEVVATINLQPVIVVEGSVPAFRSLSRGLEGEDVAQFQRFLVDSGYLAGEIDGKYSQQTHTATKAWQRDLGIPETGSVPIGSVVFVEGLPAPASVIPRRGEFLTPGSSLLGVFAQEPVFHLRATDSQRLQLTTGTEVLFTPPMVSEPWTGVLGPFSPTPDGMLLSELSGELCGSECSAIPVEGITVLSGTVVLVPEITGPVIPLSALKLDPNGQLQATLENGSLTAVTVIAEANGLAVVDGIDVGTVIRMPTQEA